MAYGSLVNLRNTPLQAARDLLDIEAQLWGERGLQGQFLDKPAYPQEKRANITTGAKNYGRRFSELFTHPRRRFATLASGIVMVAQQMCGSMLSPFLVHLCPARSAADAQSLIVNIMAFYSSSIFVKANVSNTVALRTTLGFGLVNFIFSWPAIFLIDTYGRRALLLFTIPNSKIFCVSSATTGQGLYTDNSVLDSACCGYVFFHTKYVRRGPCRPYCILRVSILRLLLDRRGPYTIHILG